MVDFSRQDCGFMRQALGCAEAAAAAGEVPVGAVLVLNGAVIATGANCPIASHDPTAHAEIQALRAGAAALSNYRMPGTTLYVTLEPCLMCAGAIVHARVQRLVYGCSDPRAGAAGSAFSVLDSAALNHRVAVSGGLLEHECGELLRNFFKVRRAP
ncbi:MAG: tRNA adenosine(34) deaminase TadA [Gammaproteobacteria bacterium]|jgi:tRNA(adenine34) deaminase|nr:tRNA adenosine(34) deaminase TadA [Gammaproteobacteria bacterium]